MRHSMFHEEGVTRANKVAQSVSTLTPQLIPTEYQRRTRLAFKSFVRPDMGAVALHLPESGALLGEAVEGVDLSEDLDEGIFHQVEHAFNECGLLVFRNQPISHEQHVRFSRRFGELDVHVIAQYLVAGCPELFRVSNLLENGKRIGANAEFWHTDMSYLATPPRCSLLYAVEVPTAAEGSPLGDTLFASTAAAYDALSDAMKKQLAGLYGIHRFADAYNREQSRRAAAGEPLIAQGLHQMTQKEMKEAAPDVLHPVVRTHPFTGRKCLYVNRGFTVGIDGMPEDEGNALLTELFAHCIRPEFMYCHKWQVGDLVMWDNCSMVHKGVGNYGPEHRRLLYRATVKGFAPY